MYILVNIVSDAPAEIKVERKHQTFEKVVSGEEKKEATMKAMFLMAVDQSKGALVQDQMEGVGDDEW